MKQRYHMPPEETIAQIQASIELAFAQYQLLRTKTEVFEQYVRAAAVHLRAASDYAERIKIDGQHQAPR
jgi:hypothetical protein